jgi:hypothetical protein
MLQDCANNNLIFRLSTTEQVIQSVEQDNASLFLAMRLLYTFLAPTHGIQGYGAFLELYVASLKSKILLITNFLLKRYAPHFGNITLEHVMNFIYHKRQHSQIEVPPKQLIILHLDETQSLMPRQGKTGWGKPKSEGIFYQIINRLYEAMALTHHTILFPVLTGTNASDIYKQFTQSERSYHDIPISGLAACHLQSILSSLGVNAKRSFVERAQFIMAGHPRLFRVFVALLSWYYGKHLDPINTKYHEGHSEADMGANDNIHLEESKSESLDVINNFQIPKELKKQLVGGSFHTGGFKKFFQCGGDCSTTIFWKIISDVDQLLPKILYGHQNSILQETGLLKCRLL